MVDRIAVRFAAVLPSITSYVEYSGAGEQGQRREYAGLNYAGEDEAKGGVNFIVEDAKTLLINSTDFPSYKVVLSERRGEGGAMEYVELEYGCWSSVNKVSTLETTWSQITPSTRIRLLNCTNTQENVFFENEMQMKENGSQTLTLYRNTLFIADAYCEYLSHSVDNKMQLIFSKGDWKSRSLFMNEQPPSFPPYKTNEKLALGNSFMTCICTYTPPTPHLWNPTSVSYSCDGDRVCFLFSFSNNTGEAGYLGGVKSELFRNKEFVINTYKLDENGLPIPKSKRQTVITTPQLGVTFSSTHNDFLYIVKTSANPLNTMPLDVISINVNDMEPTLFKGIKNPDIGEVIAKIIRSPNRPVSSIFEISNIIFKATCIEIHEPSRIHVIFRRSTGYTFFSFDDKCFPSVYFRPNFLHEVYVINLDDLLFGI